MEAGFLPVDHHMLLGFPKGPGTQGPGTQNLLRSMTLAFQVATEILG